MNSRTIAPTMEPIHPSVCSWRPKRVVARKPPTKEPAMPSRIVTIQPPGSFPGMRNFAIAPTMRPNNSHPRILMLFPPSVRQRDADELIDEQGECPPRQTQPYTPDSGLGTAYGCAKFNE